MWEERTRRQFRPHLFTPEQWAALSPNQREIVRRQRMAVVDALAVEHQRRYHASARYIALDLALAGRPDTTA
jgi:hypothetical protein